MSKNLKDMLANAYSSSEASNEPGYNSNKQTTEEVSKSFADVETTKATVENNTVKNIKEDNTVENTVKQDVAVDEVLISRILSHYNKILTLDDTDRIALARTLSLESTNIESMILAMLNETLDVSVISDIIELRQMEGVQRAFTLMGMEINALNKLGDNVTKLFGGTLPGLNNSNMLEYSRQLEHLISSIKVEQLDKYKSLLD